MAADRKSVVNPEMLKLARHLLRSHPLFKKAFVPAGDPSMMGMPPGGAPPMDPSMMGMPPGGAPPMDPSMLGMPPGGAPPMDPSMMGMPPGGAAPPPPGGGGGGGGGGDWSRILPLLSQAIQNAPGSGQLKPKIDVNVALLQISKMLARIADALGINIPASEMIATPQDLTSLAKQQQNQESPGGIPPVQPLQGLEQGVKQSESRNGYAFIPDHINQVRQRAAALAALRRRVKA